MNTEEYEALEARLRQWKPRPPSARIYQALFLQRPAADDTTRIGWLAWFGPAVAALAMLCATPLFLAHTRHSSAAGATNIVRLTGQTLEGFGTAPVVNIWHTATLATTNH